MITVTDIFAGAGGSSTGMIDVPDVEVKIAANHWQLAVDTHNLNHPDTQHACVDLHLEDPRNFPRTDILWASPECTKWSQANSKAKALSIEMGGDPTLFDDVPTDLESADEAEINRSRLLMFDVLRFIEHHRYRAVVVENVVDIATQAKYAVAWQAWRRGLDKLGYAYRVVSLNSMHAQYRGRPAPQSRDRLYIVAWPANEKAPDIDAALRPKAWCGPCDKAVEARQAWKPGRTVGKYKTQYVYVCPACGRRVEPGWVPASEAIDWTLPAERIGDRTKALSIKTMARIREGLRRYGGPIHIEAGGNQYDSLDPKHPQYGQSGAYVRAWPVNEPLRTLHTAITKAVVVPLRNHGVPKPVSSTLDTITAGGNHHGLLVPVEGRDGKEARPLDQVMRTQTCRNETGLLVPSGGTWHETAYPTDDALRTITTRDNHGLLVPYYSASQTAKPTDQPIGTLTTVDRYALVMRNNGTGAGGNFGRMVTPADEPMRTLTASSVQSILEGDRRPVAEVSDEDVLACRFRMLAPHEIAAGMSFPKTYKWAGTKREQVRMAGNAVTPPAARDLVSCIAESLGAAA